jgi:hypothetical protein
MRAEEDEKVQDGSVCRDTLMKFRRSDPRKGENPGGLRKKNGHRNVTTEDDSMKHGEKRK